MASILTLAADAVTTELNTKLTSWGYSTTTATRKNSTKFVLEELDTLAVTVLPIACPTKPAGRKTGTGGLLLEWNPTVDIDIRKRTNDDADAEDDMVELAEYIAAYFLNPRTSSYQVLNVEPSVVIPSEELQDKGLFAVAVRLTLQAHSSGESA